MSCVSPEVQCSGQPVIVTNFSGNVDYCDTNTAFLVDGELVPLRPGDYLFHEGQYWCDPDVDQRSMLALEPRDEVADQWSDVTAAYRKAFRRRQSIDLAFQHEHGIDLLDGFEPPEETGEE